ncbi:MaoC family dehydratase [Salinimonas sp. HHU 13199]|uniref:MaoC family dehydratase n=1 Tax=Salinimonas profundi TaxID=2729140 RepID=A0ABR8LM81_9ALTE|nr:MaoC family dehydratase [Salinimonas profundi]MBD3587305.1 MaoC family dehydratase [Salinimonas profundi]
MSFLKLISSAILQRADRVRLTQFKPPALPSCEYSQEHQISKRHYQQYCEQIGWGDQGTLHPCYIQMLSTPLQIKCLTTPNSPFPLMGLVHKANSIEQSRLLDVESPFTAYASYVAIRAHARGWEFDIVVTARQQRQQVYKAVATYLVKAKAPHVEPRKRKSGRQPFALPETAAKQADFTAGAAQGRQYARLSGDYNPIHLSHSTAAIFGFKRAIAHGMWTLARSVSQCAQLSNAATGLQVDASFLRPVTLPSTVSCYLADHENDNNFYVVSEKKDTPHLIGRIRISDD